MDWLIASFVLFALASLTAFRDIWRNHHDLRMRVGALELRVDELEERANPPTRRKVIR